jgi:hypothetical protein
MAPVMSEEPLDVSAPLVDGLSHISLVASTADLFYSTVQFYEALGFQAISLVRYSPAIHAVLICSLIVPNQAPSNEMTTFALTLKKRLGYIVLVKEREMM